MPDKSTKGQAVVWVIIAIVGALILYLFVKNSPLQNNPPDNLTPTASPSPTVITNTPTPAEATNEDIDRQLKIVNDDSKNIDQSLDVTPYDVLQ